MFSGRRLARALQFGEDHIHLFTPEDMVGVTGISLYTGHAPQNLDGDPVETSFDSYYKEVLEPMIQAGDISDGSMEGSYDDRKLRLSGGVIPDTASGDEGKTFCLSVGPTHYGRWKKDSERTPEANFALMYRGLVDHGNPWAYFAATIGVVVVPITTDGHVFAGERDGVDLSDTLDFPGGHSTFNIDPSEVNPLVDAARELKEEQGINMKLTPENTRILGITQHTNSGIAGFVFAVQTNVSDKYFTSGEWRKRATTKENKRLFQISSKAEAEALLHEGRVPQDQETHELLYVTHLPLEYLIDHHFN